MYIGPKFIYEFPPDQFHCVISRNLQRRRVIVGDLLYHRNVFSYVGLLLRKSVFRTSGMDGQILERVSV